LHLDETAGLNLRQLAIIEGAQLERGRARGRGVREIEDEISGRRRRWGREE
jgi:hypothetical protein